MQEEVLLSGMPQSSLAPDQLAGRNILLATDFSECSRRALDYALGIASRYQSQLHLFHCIDPAPYYLVEPDAAQITRDDARGELERLVSALGREGLARNVQIKVVVEVGNLSDILSQVVNDLDPGLIVVGTHGRTGWRKLVLGSVAELVVDTVPRPVLCVGPSTDRTRIQEFGPENILLAIESSTRSQLAKSCAFSLARKYRSHLTTIDVLENRSGSVRAKVAQCEWHKIEGSDDTLDSRPPSPLPQSTEIGTQSDLILRVADQTAADLIVLAVPETHRFTNRFLSSNSYRVVIDAACPVLTVRDR